MQYQNMVQLQTIFAHARSQPDNIALRCGDLAVTWEQFYGQASTIRNWLAGHLDNQTENRAVAFSGNSIPLVIATSAVAGLGIPWVGIDPARDLDTAAAQIDAVAPTVMLLDTALPGTARIADLAATRGMLVLPLEGIAGITGQTWSDVEWTAPPFLSIGFTSGTTGTPKLFERRCQTVNQRLDYLRDELRVGPGDVYMVTSPLAHASGHVWASAALGLGATVVLGGPDPQEIVTAIARWRVTAAFMVPPTADAFIAAAAIRRETDLSSLRALLTGGRHISARTVRACQQRLGDVLYVYYATTETGINTMAGPADLAEFPLTAGRPMPGVRLRVVDPATRDDRACGEVGQLAVFSPVNMDGYVGAVADFLHRDGQAYVLTSDYGRMDERGRLFISGRDDALPHAGSMNIVQLESELKELPQVADACLMRCSGDGAFTLAAAVVPALDPCLTREAVRRRLADLLGDPGTDPVSGGPGGVAVEVVAVRGIPYNTAGKVDVRALAALLGKGATSVR